MDCLAGKKRIVLPQIADLQLGMPDHFATVELFFPQQNSQQRTLARPVPADEPDFDILSQRRFRSIEEHLLTVGFVSVIDLQ